MSVDDDAPLRSDLIDYAALGVTVALAILVALGVEGLLRGVLALAFVTFVPGWAVITNWAAAARYSIVALSVLLSIAISAAVSTTVLWLHLWRPVGLFYLTALASAAAITYGHLRRRAAATSH